MFDWFADTLRSYPEIAIFISLALGYYFGSFPYKGLGLAAVTATLIAAVIIGQLGITISPPFKATFFLLLLFAIGHGMGPQFVRGIAKDGLRHALYRTTDDVSGAESSGTGGRVVYDAGR
jgi:putative transport protein